MPCAIIRDGVAGYVGRDPVAEEEIPPTITSLAIS